MGTPGFCSGDVSTGGICGGIEKRRRRREHPGFILQIEDFHRKVVDPIRVIPRSGVL